MKVSLNQASKDTGVSLPTLSRWRKNGLISADRNENGGYLLDTSEYDRINELKKQSPNMKDNVNGSILNNETNKKYNEIAHETRFLSLEIEMLRQRLAEKDAIIEDLRTERNDWKQQAQTLLLQAPMDNDTPQKKVSFIQRIMGKGL